MFFLILAIPIALFALLIVSTYLSPSLVVLIESFPANTRLLSLTFLSFANAAPDLLTCWSALRQNKAESVAMGISEVLGSGNFGVCIVFGTVAYMAGQNLSNDKEELIFPQIQEQPLIQDCGGKTVEGLVTGKRKGIKVFKKWCVDLAGFLFIVTVVCLILSDGVISWWECSILCVIYALLIALWIYRANVLRKDELKETEIGNAGLLSNSLMGNQLSSPIRSRSASFTSNCSGSSNVSHSSDLNDYFFQNAIASLERGENWRLSLVNSIKLGIKSFKKSREAGSFCSESILPNISDNNNDFHPQIVTDPSESSPLGSIINYGASNEQDLADINVSINANSNSNIKSNTNTSIKAIEPTKSKVQKKLPKLTVDKLSVSNNELATSLTPVNIQRSLSYELSTHSNFDTNHLISNLTPNIFNKICPIEECKNSNGWEKIFNWFCLPTKTILNSMIPIPIPLELKEKDEESFNWEYNLSKRLYVWQLFWASWIFTNFGFNYSNESFWNDFLFYTLIPSIALPLSVNLIMNKISPTPALTNNFNEAEPKHYRQITLIITLTSFLYTLKLLSTCTELLVNLLIETSINFGLSQSLLAITIISLANSAGDVITAYSLTSLHRYDVAIATVAGGTAAYLCAGVGLVPLLVMVYEQKSSLELSIDTQIWGQLASLGVSLSFIAMVAPIRGWVVEWWVGPVCWSIWLIALIGGCVSSQSS